MVPSAFNLIVFGLFLFALFELTWEELSSWLFACAVLNLITSLVSVYLSHLVFRVGCGIRSYQFQIIAFFNHFDGVEAETRKSQKKSFISVIRKRANQHKSCVLIARSDARQFFSVYVTETI